MRSMSSIHRRRMTTLKSVFRAALLLLAIQYGCGIAWSAPAAWHKWRSKTDGTLICSQTPPGSGWEKEDGPYKDARCSIAGKPGA